VLLPISLPIETKDVFSLECGGFPAKSVQFTMTRYQSPPEGFVFGPENKEAAVRAG
jgi:hypothetical protein